MAPDRAAVKIEVFQLAHHRLDLSSARIMGIVNITPDSFSDGGLHFGTKEAIAHARRLIEEGADILDLGAESSRPGAEVVSEKEELRRLMPVLEALSGGTVPISIDTRNSEVMKQALAAGADMINDITAMADGQAREYLAQSQAAVCLMHMQGNPQTMQKDPRYVDVLKEVFGHLQGAVNALKAMGIAANRIMVDPGFGFGKTVQHNLRLLNHLNIFTSIAPLLVGLSRKSVLGIVAGGASHATLKDRLPSSIAAAVMAVNRGASVVRVHDVAATRDALRVIAAVNKESP